MSGAAISAVPSKAASWSFSAKATSNPSGVPSRRISPALPFRLLDLPRAERLHEAKRTVGKAGIQRGLQHAWQRHQQTAQSVEWQHNPAWRSVGADEVHPHAMPPAKTAQAESSSPLIVVDMAADAAPMSCSCRYSRIEIAESRLPVHPNRRRQRLLKNHPIAPLIGRSPAVRPRIPLVL